MENFSRRKDLIHNWLRVNSCYQLRIGSIADLKSVFS
jgi:hypothetical protein